MKSWEEDESFLSRWLNDELSDAEKEAFEASDEGREYLALIQATDQLRAPAYDVDAGFAALSKRRAAEGSGEAVPQETPVRRLSPVRLLAVAASLALLVAVAWFWPGGDTVIQTAWGEQDIIQLPDGSEVRLNASSRLAYDPAAWPDTRSLQLEGEAFFEVQKGSDFTVSTATGTVMVLGTSFNVKSRDDQLRVVCYTGKVAVSSGSTREVLTPGMHVKLKAGQKTAGGTLTLGEGPDWLQGVTQLEGVTLAEALAELRHVYGLQIKVDETIAAGTIYTTAFPHNDLSTAVRLVLEPLELEYDLDQDARLLKVGATQ